MLGGRSRLLAGALSHSKTGLSSALLGAANFTGEARLEAPANAIVYPASGFRLLPVSNRSSRWIAAVAAAP